MGPNNSYIATLVERHSRFVMLAKVENKDTQSVILSFISVDSGLRNILTDPELHMKPPRATKANILQVAPVHSKSIPSAAEVAADAMQKIAAKRAKEEAFRRAKETQKQQARGATKRWLSNEDLT